MKSILTAAVVCGLAYLNHVLAADDKSSSANVKVVYVEKDGSVGSDSYEYLFSSAISQFVCHLVSFLLPAYASFKAIRSAGGDDDKQWLTYWVLYAFVHVIEYYLLIIVVFIPFYWEIKIAFVLWLIAPQTRGATVLYEKYLEPFLNRHENEINESIGKVGSRASVVVKDLTNQVIKSVINSKVNNE